MTSEQNTTASTPANFLQTLSSGFLGKVHLTLAELLELPQIQGQTDPNPNTVAKLKKSIAKLGKVVEPIIVELLPGEGDEEYILVSGRHRLIALAELALEAEADANYIYPPCVTQEYGSDADELLATNTSRRFSYWEKVTLLQRAFNENPGMKLTKSQKLDITAYWRVKQALTSPDLYGNLSDRYTDSTLLRLFRYLLPYVDEQTSLTAFVLALPEAEADYPNHARHWKLIADKAIDSVFENLDELSAEPESF